MKIKTFISIFLVFAMLIGTFSPVFGGEVLRAEETLEDYKQQDLHNEVEKFIKLLNQDKNWQGKKGSKNGRTNGEITLDILAYLESSQGYFLHFNRLGNDTLLSLVNELLPGLDKSERDKLIIILLAIHSTIVDDSTNLQKQENLSNPHIARIKNALNLYENAVHHYNKKQYNQALKKITDSITTLLQLMKELNIEYSVENDFDQDGLPNLYEFTIATNPLNSDTDRDGLNDYFEDKHNDVLSALLKDTNSNGVLDWEEDFDQDELTNKQEQDLQLNPSVDDTDKDLLKDGLEVKTFNSNPGKFDTDLDGLNDGAEFRFDTNPNHQDSDGDGILDGHENFLQIVENQNLGISISFDASNDAQRYTIIKEAAVANEVNIPGKIGRAVDITTNSHFNEATIAMHFTESDLAPNTDESQLQLFWFDTENMQAVPLENTWVDLEKNIVYGITNHFSEYLIIDTGLWSKNWREDLNIGGRRGKDIVLDLTFSMDSSGSMEWNDPHSLRLIAAKNFVDALLPNDRAAVVDFDSRARLIQSLTEDKEQVKKAIDKIDSSGGTNIADSIKVSNLELITNGRDNSEKVIILLTDGESNYLRGWEEHYAKEAATNNIVIYTVGLGDSIDSNLLTKIAEMTGGKYYPVKASEELLEVFKKIQRETGFDEDLDRDGLPDWVEEAGMRNSYGELIYTNIEPNDLNGDGRPDGWDSDRDGLSDREEMGQIYRASSISTSNDQSYYEMKSHPRKKDTDGDGYTDDVDLNPNKKYVPTIILLHGVLSDVGGVYGAYNALATREDVESRWTQVDKETKNDTDNANPAIFGELENQRITDWDNDGFYYQLLNQRELSAEKIRVFNYANRAYIRNSANDFKVYLTNLASVLEVPTRTHKPVVNIVVHSMGGLITRTYHELDKDARPVEIKNIITWATPHFGTFKRYANNVATIDAVDDLDKDSSLWEVLISANQRIETKYTMFTGVPLMKVRNWMKDKKNDPNTPYFIFNPKSSLTYVNDIRNRLDKIANGSDYRIVDNDDWVDVESGMGYSGTEEMDRVAAHQYLIGKRWIVVGPHEDENGTKGVAHSPIHHNADVWHRTLPILLNK